MKVGDVNEIAGTENVHHTNSDQVCVGKRVRVVDVNEIAKTENVHHTKSDTVSSEKDGGSDMGCS